MHIRRALTRIGIAEVIAIEDITVLRGRLGKPTNFGGQGMFGGIIGRAGYQESHLIKKQFAIL